MLTTPSLITSPLNDEKIIVRYRNRDIRRSDIEQICSFITANPSFGRTQLSRILCEQWNWRQPSGTLKECACRDLLLRLEEWGHVTLPPTKNGKANRKRIRGRDLDLGFDLPSAESALPDLDTDLGKLSVRPVESRAERLLWRALVDRYHYLGDGVVCGAHILYLAYLNGQIVGCLSWGAASLRNPKRDQWIGWDFERLRTRLHFIVNNQRFLILPWINIKNLGSRILSLNLRRLSRDWQARYSHQVYLAETFVDVSRFHGTVYKAANWKCLGLTAGRNKRGNLYNSAQSRGQPKAIYVYALKPLSRWQITA